MTMPPTTDTHGALFEQLRPRLTAISRRIVGSQAEAEDVVQDCYLKWHRAEQDTLATPAAWLTTVVQHHSIDRLRQRARDAAAERMAGELVADAPAASPEDGLLRRAELAEALGRMLACLSPSERLALALHEAFECGHADIAAMLGTTAVNARQHLARARRRLRLHQHQHQHQHQHLREGGAEAPADEKLCRELVRRFQAAIHGLDVPAMMMVLAAEQPVSVCDAPQLHAGDSANDASYGCRLAA
jgi:RNA polymerase sigma-70 factor (ECF subfamily)